MKQKYCRVNCGVIIASTIALFSGIIEPMVALSNQAGTITPPAVEVPIDENLRSFSRAITVKVLSGDSWGSGIIIKKDNNFYTVVTNAHVVRNTKDSYRIQTPDGLIYQAYRLQISNFQNCDLALLSFVSNHSEYAVASLGNSDNLQEGDAVIATGFPFSGDQSQDHGFKFTTGKISLIVKKSLEDGYQVGYTNDIEKGMSGGPVLDLKGNVVAINGMHAYPLWGDPYIYQDGEKPSPEDQKIMVRSSWAIPVNTFLQLAPESLTTQIRGYVSDRGN